MTNGALAVVEAELCEFRDANGELDLYILKDLKYARIRAALNVYADEERPADGRRGGAVRVQRRKRCVLMMSG